MRWITANHPKVTHASLPHRHTFRQLWSVAAMDARIWAHSSAVRTKRSGASSLAAALTIAVSGAVACTRALDFFFLRPPAATVLASASTGCCSSCVAVADMAHSATLLRGSGCWPGCSRNTSARQAKRLERSSAGMSKGSLSNV
jgi:hypothetical protein